MGSKAPEFAPADNPASDCSDAWTRLRTFLYLPLLNFYLLLLPRTLSFDWSMEAVPLVQSFDDARNLGSLVFYSVLVYTAMLLFRRLNRDVKVHVYSKDVTSSTAGNHSPQYNSNHNNSNGGLAYTYDYAVTSLSSSVKYTSGVQTNGVTGRTCYSRHNYVNTLSPAIENEHNQSSHMMMNYSNLSSCNDVTKHNNHTTPVRRRVLRSRADSGTSSSDNSDVTSHHSVRNNNADVTQYSALHILVMSLAILIVPFIPATNLFFYVGFVIAGRILYIPSMGFVLLVSYGAYVTMNSSSGVSRSSALCRTVVTGGVLVLVGLYSVRTVMRNEDWRTEEKLYRSGVDINPAKGEHTCMYSVLWSTH